MTQDTNVKFYCQQTSNFSALFAIITLGNPPNALQIINVFGLFENEILGGSMNVPPEMIGNVSVQSNSLVKQMTIYRNDEVGQAYFSNPNASPPPCDIYNYSFMIMGNGTPSFGIKKSSWTIGEPNSYNFSLSELTPLEPEKITQPAEWCKKTLPLINNPLKKENVQTDDAVATFVMIAFFCIIAAIVGYYVFIVNYL